MGVVKNLIFGGIYILIGFYLVNSSFTFIELPAFFTSLTPWIIVIAGIIVVIEGVRFLFRRSHGPSYL